MKTSQFLAVIGTVWIAPHAPGLVAVTFGVVLLIGSLYMIFKND
jgi:hypothetical protein